MIGIIPLVCTAALLIGGFFLKSAFHALQILQEQRSKEQLADLKALHFFRSFQELILRKSDINLALIVTLHLSRFAYATCAILLWAELWNDPLWILLATIGTALFSLLFTHSLPQIWAAKQTETALRISSWIATPLLVVAAPISIPMLALRKEARYEAHPLHVGQIKEKIIEMIQEAGVQSTLDQEEKELLQSVATLRDRIVREVMVPRLEMTAFPITTTIREAAKLLVEEGYSRIPLYRESVDTIVGLLHHKDVLNLYLQCQESGNPQPLEQSVEVLSKGILYTPETSRVAHLLHEFRKKQTHLAVVVDEYGGTEGVVTIEDCLEQIVGEISDEFDEEEEELYTKQPDGSWLVDARMTILDIEEEFEIKLPQEGEYDTLGGYLFHCAGEIPTKGFTVQHDLYQLEVVQSDDRKVEKVVIRPAS